MRRPLSPGSTSLAELACRDLVEAVTDFLDGALPGDERAGFEAHLAGCVGCRRHVDEVRTAIAVARSVHFADVPPEVRGRLLREFRRWRLRTGPGG